MEHNLTILNKRQEKILALVDQNTRISVAQLIEGLRLGFIRASKVTTNRDLQKLIKSGFIVRQAKARATFYELSPHYKFIKPIDIWAYFQIELDKRQGKERFDFRVFDGLRDIFLQEENNYLLALNRKYSENVLRLSPTLQKKEFERLMIELSWKSSQIEGNTYTLLETESLIKEQKEAAGHRKEEAVMILNHKKTLEYIENHKDNFKDITVTKIEDIHYLLTKDLGISRNIRKTAVGIVGTKYHPLDNEFQIKEALEETCSMVNQEKNYFAKALLLSVMIAYIQPFEDGNKRTSRLTSNAILMAYDICLLSYRSVDEGEYKKAVILFYEQLNISYFKKLFIDQFEFAIKNYFIA